jgi:hypothetical protein
MTTGPWVVFAIASAAVFLDSVDATIAVAAVPDLWFPMQILSGIAVGLLLVGLSGAAVARLPPARFGLGGAVNNAVRQLGGVFGTAPAVVMVGQTGAGIEAFRVAFLCLGLIGLAVAVLCLPPARQSGQVVLQTAA